MESETLWALIKTLQIPISLLSLFDLTAPLFPPQRIVQNNTCYDYIVVGAGSAGCVLASRLSEDPDTNVLLIEAGGNAPIVSFLAPTFVVFPRSEFDWNFTSTFDDYAAKSQNYYTKLTAGKVLGGTSSISHFIHARGAPADYDFWAKKLDDEDWRYENVLPYFKKAEKLEDPQILNSDDVMFHGLDGPMPMARLAKSLGDVYVNAFNETGKRATIDLNTDNALGYAQSLFTISQQGIRSSTALTYLTPIKDRNNLFVLRHTLATRIIFEGKRAVAVEAIRNGKKYVYKANKEVIVSAGVYNSPKLLMLSGIGPRDHLESLNIPVVADLPVGDNYQDQVSVSVVHRTRASILPPPLYTLDLFTVPFPVLTGLVTLDKQQSYADYLTFPLALPQNTPFLLLACAIVFQFRPEICDSFNNQVLLHESLYTLLGITQPYSTGTVRLKSTDPFEKPEITTGYFTNKTDLENMVKYIKDYISVGNATYFELNNAKLLDPALEECKGYEYGSDDYWECYILNNAGSVYHASSTCAMGPVLDSKLRVREVTNLRVVDASSFPNLINGGPLQVVVMVAEKAADFIKADRNNIEPVCNA